LVQGAIEGYERCLNLTRVGEKPVIAHPLGSRFTCRRCSCLTERAVDVARLGIEINARVVDPLVIDFPGV
jgi:hypothetical protein